MWLLSWYSYSVHASFCLYDKCAAGWLACYRLLSNLAHILLLLYFSSMFSVFYNARNAIKTTPLCYTHIQFTWNNNNTHDCQILDYTKIYKIKQSTNYKVYNCWWKISDISTRSLISFRSIFYLFFLLSELQKLCQRFQQEQQKLNCVRNRNVVSNTYLDQFIQIYAI